MLSVRGHQETRVSAPPVIRSSAGGPGLFLFTARRRCDPALRRHVPDGARLGRVLRVMHSTPQNASRDTSRVRFMRAGCGLCFRVLGGPFRRAPTRPKIRAEQPFTRGPKAWRSGHFGTLVGATGGTQTHSRRTGWKLGHVRHARQGLVRVSESNTKYGGKVGITGVGAAPVIAPTIGESSGIPKPKKFVPPVDQSFAPLFTGALFIRAPGLNFWDSRKATGKLRIRHVRAVMVGRQNRGQAASDSHSFHTFSPPCRVP